MRKTGMMLVGLFGILVVGGADAVYKCANVYKDMKCENPAAAKGGGWVATCGDEKTKTEIKGISVCGNGSDSVNVFVTAPGEFCFCKMIKPAVTIWVQEPDIKDAGTCSTNCDTACASAFVKDGNSLRSTMMNYIVR